MRALGLRASSGLAVNWRTVEWWGAAIALFLQTGAIFPLMMAAPDGTIDDDAKAKLRFLSLPVYAFACLILSRNFRQFLVALARNLQFNLLLAVPFISVLWSVSPSTTLRRAIGLLFSLLLAYALAIRFTPRQLLLLVLAAIGTCGILSLALLCLSPGLARMPGEDAVRGIFVHKNSLGWYAGILVMVATAAVIDRVLGMRRIAFVSLIVGLICLVGSGSMTATIAAVAAGVLFWFYSTLPKSHGISRTVFVLVFVEIIVLLLFALEEFLVPVLEALGKDATLTGRVPLWRLVDQEIARHLLLGFGYQAFWTEANPEAWAIWSQIHWMAPHAHNGFRDTLLSFGIVGTSLFAFVLIRALYQGARLQCRAPQDGWLWLNVLMVMVMVMNLTESIFLIQNDAIFILFCTAIIMFSLHTPAYFGAGHRPGCQHQAVAEP
ncbi:MAG TPA: O-antigen ligase family protein [Rhizobiaceae bacterium]|nr:O-antigen ligase family protein [Rhizobiaceae bacterium]